MTAAQPAVSVATPPAPQRPRGPGWWRVTAVVAATAAALTPAWSVADAQQDPAGPSDSTEAAPACPDAGMPRAGFPDAVGNAHERSVACVAWYGIARGVKPGAFGPTARVRRDQLASFVARLLDTAGVMLPEARDQGFADVHGNPHADRVNQLAELGVVQGATATNYEPARAVRRDQMASFLVRAYELAHGGQLEAPQSGFDDTQGNTHETAIDKAAAAGFARGTTAGTYRPADAVRRDQMASFLARTLERAAADGHVSLREPVQPTLSNESRLHARGVGPVEVGMTLAGVEQQTGRRIEVHEFETFGGHCYYAQPEGVAAYTFLVVAPGDQPSAGPREGVVMSVTTGWEPPHTATMAGVAPGDAPVAVEAAYGTGRLERQPHLYQPGGAYLDVFAADGQHGLRFEVGGGGVIEAVHSGDADAITLPEGCA